MVCQEKNAKKIKKFFYPKSIDFCKIICYNYNVNKKGKNNTKKIKKLKKTIDFLIKILYNIYVNKKGSQKLVQKII